MQYISFKSKKATKIRHDRRKIISNEDMRPNFGHLKIDLSACQSATDSINNGIFTKYFRDKNYEKPAQGANLENDKPLPIHSIFDADVNIYLR